MFIPDMPPEFPVFDTPIMLAMSETGETYKRTIGRCQLAENPMQHEEAAVNMLGPVTSSIHYFRLFENLRISGQSKVSLLEDVQHGHLKFYPKDGAYLYIPNDDYVGLDKAKVLVEIGGYQVEITYIIKVIGPDGHASAVTGYDPYKDPENCPNGKFWKISPDGETIPLKRSGVRAIESWVNGVRFCFLRQAIKTRSPFELS